LEREYPLNPTERGLGRSLIIETMVDITHKSNSLRKAIATAIVSVSKQETIDAIKNKTVPKGDVYEFSSAAGEYNYFSRGSYYL
jgi:molybdenum cofactor biosynthesis enzyme